MKDGSKRIRILDIILQSGHGLFKSEPAVFFLLYKCCLRLHLPQEYRYQYSAE